MQSVVERRGAGSPSTTSTAIFTATLLLYLLLHLLLLLNPADSKCSAQRVRHKHNVAPRSQYFGIESALPSAGNQA